MPELLGVGVDLCGIARIERAIEKAHFYERVFTPEERAYLNQKGKGRAQSAAAMFAAKEAVAKALGTGFSGGVMPWNISVVHDEKGAPAAELSLSHEGDSAIAFAVIGGF